MEPLEFYIENRKEDYLPAFPDYGQSVFKQKRWFMLAVPVFFFLIIMALVFTFKSKPVKEEWGYTWTAVVALALLLGIGLYDIKRRQNHIKNYLGERESKGGFKVYVDLSGIKINYRAHVELFPWDSISQITVHEHYISFQNLALQHVLMFPKGKMENAQWVRIENYLLKLSEEIKRKV